MDQLGLHVFVMDVFCSESIVCVEKGEHGPIGHCWNQVADEDAYIAEQLHRIDMLDGKCDELSERLAETSSEVSMVHDYTSGIHFALVEAGGFLRNGLGLSHD